MNIGDVVYYIKKNGHLWSVNFGVISEVYHGCVYIDLYCLKDTREIDGIPVNEFVTPTKWMKLPKGWTYNTELFKLEWKTLDLLHDNTHAFSICNPEDIKKAIEIGVLIKKENYDFCTFESEITEEGWRIVRKYKQYEYNTTGLSLYNHEVYRTYKEAHNVIIAHEKELERQAELSDEEWSIEQIQHNLDRLKTWKSESEIDHYREFLLSQDRIEDIETRVFGGDLQWKYWKNKKWVNVGY